ncbi:MAG: hypothetical protein CVT48_04480, partial [Thermoplasmata archaeon HGW-Thermoplasmata-1]
MNKWFAIVMFVIFASASLAGCIGGDDSGDAAEEVDIESIPRDGSVRAASLTGVVASNGSPFYALIGTPVAAYYENGVLNRVPLLVKDEAKETKAVDRFLEMYGTQPDLVLGDRGVKETSLEVAEKYWTSAKTAMLIEDSQAGYEMAVVAVPAACYLNIPVIVAAELDDAVISTLEKLGVEATITCGGIGGHGKTLSLEDYDVAHDLVISLIGGVGSVKYLAIANPLDVTALETLEKNVPAGYPSNGEIADSSAGGGTPAGGESGDGTLWKFTVPEGYDYTLCWINLTLDVPATYDLRGDMVQYHMFWNSPDGKREVAYGRSPGGRAVRADDGTPQQVVVEYMLPLIEQTGEYEINLIASCESNKADTLSYAISIELLKVESPVVYPLMPGLSSLAPYLSAVRQGMVLAEPEFAMMHPGYMGCVTCGEPTYNSDMMESANIKAAYIHGQMTDLLAKLAGMDANDRDALAEYYYNAPIDIALIADTNMVPHFYYGGGSAVEGYGEPGDNFYQDVNVDYEMAPEDPSGTVRVELPLARITGYDAMDASALLARGIFYYDILDNAPSAYDGASPVAWKDAAYSFIGGAVPVELLVNTQEECALLFTQNGGFTTYQTINEASGKNTAQGIQEGSNFIWFCAHGFYCWYAPGLIGAGPAAVDDLGSAYDSVHVKEMNFGPGIIAAVSCVTGRIDGLLPELCLSQAYLHSGMNVYIGATRSTPGFLAVEGTPVNDAYGGRLT